MFVGFFKSPKKPNSTKLKKLKKISLLLLTLLLLCSQLSLLITTLVPLSNQGKVQSKLYLPATASAVKPAPLLEILGGSEGGMGMASYRRAAVAAPSVSLSISTFENSRRWSWWASPAISTTYY